MKTSLMMASAAALFVASSSAFAFELSGNVDGSCSIDESGLGNPTLSLTAAQVNQDQSLGELAYGCNEGGGFVIELSSANNGRLVSGIHRVNYTMNFGTPQAGAALAVACIGNTPIRNGLGSPFVACETNTMTSGVGSIADNTATLDIRTTEPAPAAGDYQDTITVTISGKAPAAPTT